MYSSDRMKTMIRMFKDYGKNIKFRDCLIALLFLFIWEEKRYFWFFSVILLNALPNHYIVNRNWTTFYTLAKIGRDCKERQLCTWVWCTYSQRNFTLLLWIIWALKQLILSNKNKSSNVQYKFHLYHLYHELCMLVISLCSTLNTCRMARC